MKQEIDKKIMFVIMIIAIISIPVYKLITNKDNKIEKNEIAKNKLAMYVNEGDGKYQEYKNDIFPEGYKLNIEKSKCVDNEGNELREITDKIVQDGNKITVKSNKTVYCTLYFDKKIAPKEFKFYIKEEKEEKYTKEITNIVHIEVEEDNVKEYCVSEEETSEHCDWQEMNNKTIDSEYTFANETNEEKKVYAYVRNEYELDTQKEDKITFDNVAPVIENLTVENINSRSYKGTISNITDNLSGVDKHYFSNSGSNYTEEIVDNITYSGTKGASGAVYAYATDKAGNTSIPLNKSVTIGGTGTSTDPYHIYYIEDLVDLQVAVNKGTTYAGKTFTLDRSLDFKTTGSYENSARTNYGDINGTSGTQGLLTELTTGRGWKPIGLYTDNEAVERPFSGIFDGKNNTISNLYINNNIDTASVGLFSLIKNGEISNLTISGQVTTSVNANVGAFVAWGINIKLNNCHNQATVKSNVGRYQVGGIVGLTHSNIEITNCTNVGNISNGNSTAGIIANISRNDAETNINAKIKNCENKGTILNSLGSSSMGGIVGRTEKVSITLTISNCKNYGLVTTSKSTTAEQRIGGIMGVASHGNLVTIENCDNYGIVKSEYNSSNTSFTGNGGGILGRVSGDSQGTITKVINSNNHAEVNGMRRGGGLVGQVNGGGTLYIDKSYNEGKVVSSPYVNYQDSCSGIVGFINVGKAYILNSFNKGIISSQSLSAAGFAGNFDSSNTNMFVVVNSYNIGNITNSRDKASGIIHSLDNNGNGYITLKLNNVYTAGTLSGKTGNYGVGNLGNNTIYSGIANVYHLNSYTASNKGSISGVATKTINDIKNQTFVNTLNTNKGKITLKSIDSRISGYTLCNWKLGSSGYPELDC